MKKSVLVIFGSSVRGSNPRDIDVACEGTFGPEEEALVRRWAAERGLPGDLPIDAKSVYIERRPGVIPTLTLPTPRPREEGGDFVVLQGETTIEWARSYELPAQIRAVRSVDELLAVLRTAPHGARCALFIDSAEQRLADHWGAYTQGRLALRNAIAKCPFWELAEALDPRVAFIKHIAHEGVPEALRPEIARGSAAGGNVAGDCWVMLDGIQPTHGRLIPWAEVFVA